MANTERLLSDTMGGVAAVEVRSELSKALSMATKDYRAKRGIKDPSKAEIKQTSDEIVKE